MIMRMFGFLPDAAADAAGPAGAAFCAWASTPDVIAAVATNVEVPSRMFRRLIDFASVLPDEIAA